MARGDSGGAPEPAKHPYELQHMYATKGDRDDLMRRLDEATEDCLATGNTGVYALKMGDLITRALVRGVITHETGMALTEQFKATIVAMQLSPTQFSKKPEIEGGSLESRLRAKQLTRNEDARKKLEREAELLGVVDATFTEER